MVRLRFIWRFRIVPGPIRADPAVLCAKIPRGIEAGQRDDEDYIGEDKVTVLRSATINVILNACIAMYVLVCNASVSSNEVELTCLGNSIILGDSIHDASDISIHE